MRSKKDTYRASSYTRYTWHRFKKNKPALFSVYLLVFICVVALLADILATNQPWYARYKGKSFYPAFQVMFNSNKADSVNNIQSNKYEKLVFSRTDWARLKLDEVIWAPIPYSTQAGDPLNRNYKSPSDKQSCTDAEGNIVPCSSHFRHKLGTNYLGIDLAAGLIHGTRIALRVGLVSMGIAVIIGLLLGAIGGYFGDKRFRVKRGLLICLLTGIFLGFFYAFTIRANLLEDAAKTSLSDFTSQAGISLFILLIWVLLFLIIGKYLSRLKWFSKLLHAPVDQIISRIIEVMDGLPKLILIITLASLFREKSLWLIMVIIGLSSWTGIARLTRAEFLKSRHLEYVEAARAMGLTHWRIIFRHILPNAIAPVFIVIAFGIASAILAESSLSFLGIGVPLDSVTWGSLLSSARERTDAWWLIIFPGLAIFITVTAYNLIGEGLREALDPKNRF